MGFRLAPLHLILGDFEGSKIKVILFDVKYVKKRNSYDVGPNGDYTYWASFRMTLKQPRTMCGVRNRPPLAR